MSQVLSRVIEVCIFKMVGGSPLYLMLHRSANDPLYPGLWQIVTGMLEDNEHSVGGALRETREETGLTPARCWIAPYVDTFYSASSDTVHLSPFFAMQVRENDEPRLSSEHQAYEWLLREAAESRLVWPGQKRGLKLVHEYVVGGLPGGTLTEVTNLAQFERKKS